MLLRLQEVAMRTQMGLFVTGMTLAAVACGNDPVQRITVSSCGVNSVLAMPPGATVVDLNDCGGCGCCDAGASADCEQCGVEAALAANGISSPDAFGTQFVDCVSGNADAPMGEGALFLMPSLSVANTSDLTLVLDQGVTAFGLSVAPSGSDSGVPVTLVAYAADGKAIGTTTFDFRGLSGGSCDSIDASARFLGLQSCGAPITRVVVRAEGYNMAVDMLTFL